NHKELSSTWPICCSTWLGLVVLQATFPAFSALLLLLVSVPLMWTVHNATACSVPQRDRDKNLISWPKHPHQAWSGSKTGMETLASCSFHYELAGSQAFPHDCTNYSRLSIQKYPPEETPQQIQPTAPAALTDAVAKARPGSTASSEPKRPRAARKAHSSGPGDDADRALMLPTSRSADPVPGRLTKAPV